MGPQGSDPEEDKRSYPSRTRPGGPMKECRHPLGFVGCMPAGTAQTERRLSPVRAVGGLDYPEKWTAGETEEAESQQTPARGCGTSPNRAHGINGGIRSIRGPRGTGAQDTDRGAKQGRLSVSGQSGFRLPGRRGGDSHARRTPKRETAVVEAARKRHGTGGKLKKRMMKKHKNEILRGEKRKEVTNFQFSS